MEKLTEFKKVFIKDLNQAVICALCSGYLIDATTLTECNHVFCRGCILRYFESNKAVCPTCNTVCKKKNHNFFRADPQLQSIVYKMVPGLFSREMQRREDFYRSTGVRASSSCSDDSVFERERDMINDDEVLVASHVGDKTQFFGTEDSISLSLEYYQRHLDKSEDTKNLKVEESDKNDATQNTNSTNNNNSDVISAKHKLNGSKNQKDGISLDCKSDKRFLQCPAAVAMKHLQKFIRMKFALSVNHKVDIIYRGEVLPAHFSLMDVAYTFKWTRIKPLRFFYRILVPSKIQPIKIVNTTLSTGGKQLQIVSLDKVEPRVEQFPKKEDPEIEMKKIAIEEIKTEDESNREKEHLLANLQLQSKSKVQNLTDNVPDKGAHPPQIQDCVFTYDEQDREEIKRFAETRDREWALQKTLDENREKNIDHHHFSKKRKRSKHSKNDFTYKKRKLHAEITNKEEDLKLKVKLTQHNGHKHKHHKSSSLTDSSAKKEKLFQMRQVRHKHVSSEDKNIQTIQSGSSIVSKETITTITDIKEEIKQPKVPILEFKNKLVETSVSDEVKAPNGVKPLEETKKLATPEMNSAKNIKTESLGKQPSKEWSTRVPTVQLERNELTEQQAQKSFYKSFQIYAERYHKTHDKPVQNNKNDIGKLPQKTSPMTLTRPVPSQLERKIANLQQRCTIEAKNRPPIPENKIPEKKIIPHDSIKTVVSTSSPYPAGFTVSKVEAGIKRKIEDEKLQDKRPSLEITLINPPPTVETKPLTTVAKRPPPPTIPLDRIKKSLMHKSGISIIPKIPEKCDNIGALDLSAKPLSKEESLNAKPVNGFSSPPSVNKDGKTVNMSNLQMLSKVATEHSALNKNPNKPRPQVPNLHSLQKIPSLEKINKNQFRAMNPQMRTVRPNQNQSIRNIPNPSLLIRQQNQNRLNSLNPIRVSTNGEKETKTASTTSTASSEPIKSSDIKPTENKEGAT